ncbi:hypothetical protein BLS_005829 [Venturia inaequalis]|uniref:J domain-containing protein n=1 Tax=Venturia inaequalis TaxID=5025 RepID=A0A8H3V5T4_VENIN|nr:hypothetical protein BLS_005829 [Venturia inaequalis]
MDPKVSQAFAALGLPITASRTAAKAEYRKLALLQHPDKVPTGRKAQAQEDMKVLNAAIEALESYFDDQQHDGLVREYLERMKRERQEKKERARAAAMERMRRVRQEAEARETRDREAWVREEERRLLAEARVEHTSWKQQKEEDDRSAREWREKGEEEVRRMGAAWQQQREQAGIWLGGEKKAPAAAPAVVEEEKEKETDPLPSDGKIRFSLLKRKQ